MTDRNSPVDSLPSEDPAGGASIFDLDGTLADSMPVHYRAWSEVSRRMGFTLPEARFYSLGGVPTLKIASLLIKEQGLALDPRDVLREKEQAFLRHFEEVGPIAPVVAIARRCRELGQPVAIASGGSRAMVERTLRQLGLFDWFPVIVSADDTALHKPNPDVFLEAARRLGVEPTTCTVYEDTDLGLEAARRAGMRGIDVRPIVAAAARPDAAPVPAAV